VRRFVKDILDLVGKPTDEIRFKRQSIANESETVADIAVMRDYIDQETALKLNPYIQPEEIPDIETRLTKEKMNTAPDPNIADPLKEERNA
jgi:hypothetical protein